MHFTLKQIATPLLDIKPCIENFDKVETDAGKP